MNLKKKVISYIASNTDKTVKEVELVFKHHPVKHILKMAENIALSNGDDISYLTEQVLIPSRVITDADKAFKRQFMTVN